MTLPKIEYPGRSGKSGRPADTVRGLLLMGNAAAKGAAVEYTDVIRTGHCPVMRVTGNLTDTLDVNGFLSGCLSGAGEVYTAC